MIKGKDKSQPDTKPTTIAGFEKLWIWQKANDLVKEIQKILKNIPYNERYRVKDQLDRSSTSVTANIAEGHTSYYYQD